MSKSTTPVAPAAPRRHSVAWAAHELECTRPTIYSLLRQGKLKAFKVGSLTRIDDESIAEYRRVGKAAFALRPPCGRNHKPAGSP